MLFLAAFCSTVLFQESMHLLYSFPTYYCCWGGQFPPTETAELATQVVRRGEAGSSININISNINRSSSKIVTFVLFCMEMMNE